jgi:hypothetical protein
MTPLFFISGKAWFSKEEKILLENKLLGIDFSCLFGRQNTTIFQLN